MVEGGKEYGGLAFICSSSRALVGSAYLVQAGGPWFILVGRQWEPTETHLGIGLGTVLN